MICTIVIVHSQQRQVKFDLASEISKNENLDNSSQKEELYKELEVD